MVFRNGRNYFQEMNVKTFQFDVNSLLGCIRTAGALLIGNSILIYTGIIGKDMIEPEWAAGKLVLIGAAIAIFSSFVEVKK